MPTETQEILSVLEAEPGRTLSEIRDALRAIGRVSITVADVARVLAAYPGTFLHDDAVSPRWWPASAVASGESFTYLSARVVTTQGAASTPIASAESKPTGSMPALYRWQREALQSWKSQGRRGVIEAVTGTGKTMVGVAATIDELAAGGQVCVVVPTKDLLVQWNDVLSQCLPSGFSVGLLGDGHRGTLGRHDVLVAIVNSARGTDMHPRRPGGLLVADECHRYGSEGNRLALEVGFSRRLGLSATYVRADDGHLTWLNPYFGGTCYRMGYAAAISDGVTARFSVALVGVEFTAIERAEYEELSLLMSSTRAKLIARGAVPAEPIGVFLAAVSRLAQRGDGEGGGGGAAGYGSHGDSNSESTVVLARGYLAAMMNRKRLLADTPAKLEALSLLTPAITGADRVIVFTQTINSATVAAKHLRDAGVSAQAMHSEQSSVDRRDALNRFAVGALQAVVAPHILDEGVDVPAADLAIIMAASRSRRQMVQRMGRILRRKPDGRLARFVMVFVEETVEDPAHGAHDLFLDEVTDVAESVRIFNGVGAADAKGAGSAVVADLCAFVNDLGFGVESSLSRGTNHSTSPRVLPHAKH